MPTDKPRAIVLEIDGKLVPDDPDAVAMTCAVGKHNCRGTLKLNADRLAHFRRRFKERGMTVSDVVIVIVNVDDVHGGPLADALMPGMNWQKIRDCGEIPFARGLVGREGIQEALNAFDQEAAKKLRDTTNIAVVVVDYGVAEVFRTLFQALD